MNLYRMIFISNSYDVYHNSNKNYRSFLHRNSKDLKSNIDTYLTTFLYG